MRALSACLTVVLGLGLAAMAACSSTSSDDSAGGGTGGTSTGGTSTGGTTTGGTTTGGTTAAAAGDTGAAGAADCVLLSTDPGSCSACLGTSCADQEGACQKEEACDAALAGNDPPTFITCVCTDHKTIAACAATLSAVDATAKAVTDCAKANCATECGL